MCYLLQLVFSVFIQNLEVDVGVCLFDWNMCYVELMFEGEVFVELVLWLLVDFEVMFFELCDCVVVCMGCVMVVVLLLIVVGILLGVLVVFFVQYLGI